MIIEENLTLRSVKTVSMHTLVCFLLLSMFIFVEGCAGIPGLIRSGVPGPALQLTADPAWYKKNETLIEAYLESLPDSSIGKVLPGIRLSDGELWLKGYFYLGQGVNIPQGLSVRLVRKEKRIYAYVWVDESLDSFIFEPCQERGQKGIRARQAGGGTFAWMKLNAESGVVYTQCPPEAWLPASGLLSDEVSKTYHDRAFPIDFSQLVLRYIQGVRIIRLSSITSARSIKGESSLTGIPWRRAFSTRCRNRSSTFSVWIASSSAALRKLSRA